MKNNQEEPLSSNAHWSRLPIYVQQVFFRCSLANFDAQYGKFEVFVVQTKFYSKIDRVLILFITFPTNKKNIS